MKLFIAVVFVMCIVLAVGAASAASQSVTSTSGAITGRVVDDTGGVLPGVGVTGSRPAMMGTRTATTEGDGSYRFPAVPPGVYTVAFELSGFKALERSDIQVGLGFTATVNVELKLATMNETVVVTGESPVVDAHATTLTSSYSAEAIKSLP